MSTTAEEIYSLHERRQAGGASRGYLGVSQLGHECERFLWLNFRGAAGRPFDGRMLRLFDTGHREEARLVEEMRAAGIVVSDTQPDGRQWSVEAFGGHMRGHLDAALHRLPEAYTVWHVGEFKTHNDKSFKELEKKGVKAAKPMHWHQMNVYAGLTGMEWAFYVAVNKNDDRIYTERLAFDQADFDKMMARGERVIFLATPPPKAGETADAFVCKWCDHKGICWGTDVPPAGCRTCAHVTPQTDGAWHCTKHGEALDANRQRAGCGEHRVIPILLANFADAVDSDGDSVTYAHRDTGVQFVNGPRPSYSSAEIAACEGKAALGNPEVDALREEFSGVIHA